MPSPYHDPSALTILRSINQRPCTKTIFADGRVQPYGHEVLWVPRPLLVPSFARLGAVLYAQSLLPYECVYRAALRDGVAVPDSGIIRSKDRTFEGVPRTYVAFDFDGAEATDVNALVQLLPLPFRTARAILCWTSSQGIRPGLFCRPWFKLSRPVTAATWKTVMAPIAAQFPWAHIDLSFYSDHRIHYTARPIFVGREDPQPQRIELLEGATDTVDLSAWSEEECNRQPIQVGVVVQPREDVIPSHQQIALTVERIRTSTTHGGRHDHAGNAAAELWALGAPTDVCVEEGEGIIRRGGREPRPGEVAEYLADRIARTRAGTWRSDNPPVSQVFAGEVVAAPSAASAPEAAAAATELVQTDTEGAWVNDPVINAKRFLRTQFGEERFLHWNGTDYVYENGKWQATEEPGVLAKRVLNLTHLSPRKANDCATAMRGLRLFERLTPPCLLSTRRPIAGGVCFRNGWLPLDDGAVLRPHAPDHFILSVLAVDYAPTALCPVFDRYLASCFPNDPDSQKLVFQMLGYLMVPDNRFQKMFVISGKSRSGKGTLCRVIQRILGDSVVSTPLASLSTNFGPWTWLDRQACIIPEANDSGAAGPGLRQAIAPHVVELIKMVSGSDAIQIDRKGLPQFNGTLPLRFVLVCNSLPSLLDHSGAFLQRVVALRFMQCFAANPDITLDDRLAAEAPGIAAKAVQALRGVYVDGRFVQPDSGLALLEAYRRQTSPVRAFADDCLQVAPPAAEALPRSTLYQVFTAWCAENGRHPLALDRLLSQLEHHVTFQTTRMRAADGTRPWGLKGVMLSVDGAALLTGSHAPFA